MLIMVGASASGKTEIAKELIRTYGFKKMVTTTTRPKREGEVDGVDYHFLDEQSFLLKKNNNDFLEVTFYNGNYYGTDIHSIGENKVLIVDPKGANVLFQKLQAQAVIFLIETTKKIRQERMLIRGDAIETINARLRVDDAYFNAKNLIHIDHIIHNNDHTIEALTEKIYHLYKEKVTVSKK